MSDENCDHAVRICVRQDEIFLTVWMPQTRKILYP
jgi:hypothetical protein